MTYYMDLLWAINFGMDTLITATASMIMRNPITLKRLFAGAALSAFISVIFIIYHIASYLSPYICSLFTLLPCIFISLGITSVYDLVKKLFILYITSLLFGGFIFFIMLSSDSLPFIQEKSYSIVPVAISAIAISTLSFMGKKLFNTYILNRNLCYKLKVHFMKKTVCGTGFTDTGNFLKDPLTGKGVIIASVHSIMGLFPKGLFNEPADLSTLQGLLKISEDPSLARKVRIIPYSAFGEKQKLMPAFVSDFTEITSPKGRRIIIQNLTIAIAPKIFNLPTDSGFILNPEIFK